MGCTASQPRAQDERTANLVVVGARDDDSAPSASEWRIAHTGDRVLLCHKYLTLVLPLHSCAIAMWVHGPSDANKPLRQSWLYCRDQQSGPPCSIDAIFAEDDLQPELAPLTDTVPIGSWFIRHLGEFVFRFDYLVKGQLAVVNPTDPLYLKRNGLSGCGVTMLWGDLSLSPSSKTGATDDLSNPNLFKTSVAAGSSWCVAMTDDCVLLSHRYLTLVLPHNTTRFAMWVHGPADEGGVARQSWEGPRTIPPNELVSDVFSRSITAMAPRLLPLTPNVLITASGWSINPLGDGVYNFEHVSAPDVVHYIRPGGLHCNEGPTMLWGDLRKDLPQPAWRFAQNADYVLLVHKYVEVVLPFTSCSVALQVRGPADVGRPARRMWLFHRERQPPTTPLFDLFAGEAYFTLREKLKPLGATETCGLWVMRHRGNGVFRIDYDNVKLSKADPLFLSPAGLEGCGTTMLWGDKDRHTALIESAPASPHQAGSAGPPRTTAECVVCLTRPPSHVLVPCGHLVLCPPCTMTVLESKTRQCPVCRSTIERGVEVFT
jgi:hypothetical protein